LYLESLVLFNCADIIFGQAAIEINYEHMQKQESFLFFYAFF